MACQLPEAISKIEEILSKNVEGVAYAMLSGIQINMLNEAKNNLKSSIEIRMARMQSNTTGSESIDNTKKDFRSEFKNKRPSAAKWVDKEVAKFDVATQAISDGTNNSTAGFVKDFYGDKANTGTYTKDDVIYLSTNGKRTGRVIPVKNGVLQGAYKNIDKAIEAGAKFVADTSKHLASTGKYNVGEVELAEYLQSKGYTREDKDGYGLWSKSKVDAQVETKSQVETKIPEPEIKYGSIVKYKPENGTEGYYIVRGITSNGGIQLTDTNGKNFSGTPKVDKVRFVKQLEIKTYNKVDYIVDSNNRIYTSNGEVVSKTYVDRLLNEFGETNENENKTNNKYELFPNVYANEDQENAIDDIKEWYKSNKSNTYLLKGRGGTGKTTIVGEVIKQLGIDNRRVVFSAFSNKAVKVLSNANKDNEYKDSKYLTTAQILKLKPARDTRTGKQKFVVDAYADEKLTSSDKIIVIDEASMLQNKQQKEIEAKAKSLGIKIIYMGDDVQLPPVDELDSNGKSVKEALVFDEHKKTGDVSELTKRMRQKGESPILPVTDVLANAVKNELDPNKIVFEQGTEIKDGDGVIFLNKNAGELDIMEMFIKDFKKDPEGTKFIHYNASDNEKTKSKNDIIRRELYGKDFNLPENKYMKGEQVIFDNGYFYQDEKTGNNISIDGATDAKVLESHIVKNKPINYFHGKQKRTIRLDVYSVTVQENDSDGVGYIHEIDIPFNINRLEEIIKEEQKDLGVYPGGLKDAFASISYSYVITSHKSQGSTYNNAYVDIGNIFGIKATDNDTKLKSAYVATSRPRHKLVIVGANTNGKTVSVDEAIELIKEDSQSYNPQSEPGVVDNNKYETISKDDIEAAKDIMSNNKKECE